MKQLQRPDRVAKQWTDVEHGRRCLVASVDTVDAGDAVTQSLRHQYGAGRHVAASRPVSPEPSP
jgi:hypothetical protein